MEEDEAGAGTSHGKAGASKQASKSVWGGGAKLLNEQILVELTIMKTVPKP